MSQKNMQKLKNLIKNHPVFGFIESGRNYSTIQMQIMTLLAVLGQEESSGAHTRDNLLTGYGTHYNYCSFVVEAF